LHLDSAGLFCLPSPTTGGRSVLRKRGCRRSGVRGFCSCHRWRASGFSGDVRHRTAPAWDATDGRQRPALRPQRLQRPCSAHRLLRGVCGHARHPDRFSLGRRRRSSSAGAPVSAVSAMSAELPALRAFAVSAAIGDVSRVSYTLASAGLLSIA
jgi:hypothetical protein